jgi:hypothetical protein
LGSENAEEVTTDYGAGHSQKDVQGDPFAGLIDDLAPTKSCHEPRPIHVRIDITFHLEIGTTAVSR